MGVGHVALPVSRLLAAVAVALAVISMAPAAERDSADGKPTAALILDGGSPTGLLLESELLTGDKTQWLERTEFEQLIREQQLGAALQPEAGQHRIELGGLLQANVLVILRRRETPKPYFQIVLCETAGGLRLMVDSRLQTDDAAADARSLAASVRRGLEIYREEIREVDVTVEEAFKVIMSAGIVKPVPATGLAASVPPELVARAVGDD